VKGALFQGTVAENVPSISFWAQKGQALVFITLRLREVHEMAFSVWKSYAGHLFHTKYLQGLLLGLSLAAL
jgi:hypothetical protein